MGKRFVDVEDVAFGVQTYLTPILIRVYPRALMRQLRHVAVDNFVIGTAFQRCDIALIHYCQQKTAIRSNLYVVEAAIEVIG